MDPNDTTPEFVRARLQVRDENGEIVGIQQIEFQGTLPVSEEEIRAEIRRIATESNAVNLDERKVLLAGPWALDFLIEHADGLIDNATWAAVVALFYELKKRSRKSNPANKPEIKEAWAIARARDKVGQVFEVPFASLDVEAFTIHTDNTVTVLLRTDSGDCYKVTIGADPELDEISVIKTYTGNG